MWGASKVHQRGWRTSGDFGERKSRRPRGLQPYDVSGPIRRSWMGQQQHQWIIAIVNALGSPCGPLNLCIN